jgi:hypothetical protein
MKKKKSNKKNWFVTKSIRFDQKKLDEAKKKDTLKYLPDLCRKQLDEIIK